MHTLSLPEARGSPEARGGALPGLRRCCRVLDRLSQERLLEGLKQARTVCASKHHVPDGMEVAESRRQPGRLRGRPRRRG